MQYTLHDWGYFKVSVNVISVLTARNKDGEIRGSYGGTPRSTRSANAIILHADSRIKSTRKCKNSI